MFTVLTMFTTLHNDGIDCTVCKNGNTLFSQYTIGLCIFERHYNSFSIKGSLPNNLLINMIETTARLGKIRMCCCLSWMMSNMCWYVSLECSGRLLLSSLVCRLLGNSSSEWLHICVVWVTLSTVAYRRLGTSTQLYVGYWALYADECNW